MPGKEFDFDRLLEKSRERDAYWVERAILAFTAEIAARMEELGVTRSELARRIGTSPAYVTKLLRGSTNFTFETAVKVARAVDAEFLCHLQPNGARSCWYDHWPVGVERERKQPMDMTALRAQFRRRSVTPEKADDPIALTA